MSKLKTNYHSHSQFCDGRDAIEDIIKEAIKEGFTAYGISPHSPTCVESTANMSYDSIALYNEEFSRLKKIYSPKIELYKGMEVDYINDECGPHSNIYHSLGLDYIIGSIHFIPCGNSYTDIDCSFEKFKLKIDSLFDGDIKLVVDSFFAQSKKMIEKGGFDLLGHFDKIGHNAGHYQAGIESEKWYSAYIDEIIALIKKKDLVIEINTKAWNEHSRMFPNQRYFDTLFNNNVRVVVNSDAHYSSKINAGRDQAICMLYDAGYRSICEFHHGEWQETKIALD